MKPTANATKKYATLAFCFFASLYEPLPVSTSHSAILPGGSRASTGAGALIYTNPWSHPISPLNHAAKRLRIVYGFATSFALVPFFVFASDNPWMGGLLSVASVFALKTDFEDRHCRVQMFLASREGVYVSRKRIENWNAAASSSVMRYFSFSKQK